MTLLFDIEPEVVAWQRRVRLRRMAENPRQQGTSLDDYKVEQIGRIEAAGIITKYEWLGTMGLSVYFIGLFSPCRELEGAVCFGGGPQGDTRKIIGEPALCLERGACAHWAPPNAASFLISRAVKLVKRMTGVSIFYAYGDPEAGEYGAVYQAANWVYLGQGLKNGKDRPRRLAVLPPGKDPDDPRNWRTTRVLREPRQGRRLSFAEARKLGWRIAEREAKHLYAVNIGRDRRKWLKGIVGKPYPAPRPHLKRELLASPMPPQPLYPI